MTRARDLADSADKDIAGTLTLDGLTVDGDAVINDTIPQLQLMESDTTDVNSVIKTTAGQFRIQTINDAANSTTNRFIIDHATGDISFYENTGTEVMKLNASGKLSLGNNLTNPDNSLLHLTTGGTTNFGLLQLESTDSGSATAPDIAFYRNSASPADGDNTGALQFYGNNSVGDRTLMGQFYNSDGSKTHQNDLELSYPDLSKFEIYTKGNK